MKSTSSLLKRRQEALHRLCKGSGLTASAVARLADIDDLFGTSSPTEVVALLQSMVSTRREDRTMRALAVALGVGSAARESLTERRIALAQELGITPRTLARDEDAAIAVIARELGEARQPASSVQHQRVDDGDPELARAIALLQKAYELGYSFEAAAQFIGTRTITEHGNEIPRDEPIALLDNDGKPRSRRPKRGSSSR